MRLACWGQRVLDWPVNVTILCLCVVFLFLCLCRADVNVQKILSLDYASQMERNKAVKADMIKKLQKREGDTGSSYVQSECMICR